MLLVFGKNGKTAHRAECRFALGASVNTLSLPRTDVIEAVTAEGGRECQKCKPFAKCKVFRCDSFRESGKGFCKPHIL